MQHPFARCPLPSFTSHSDCCNSHGCIISAYITSAAAQNPHSMHFHTAACTLMCFATGLLLTCRIHSMVQVVLIPFVHYADAFFPISAFRGAACGLL